MNLSAWMVNTINIRRASTVGNDGDLTYAAAVEVACRQEDTQKIVRDPDGVEMQASNVIATTTQILWDDLIWLENEDPDTDASHRIISLRSAEDKQGNNRLYEVYL